MSTIDDTDKLSEIISENNYEEVAIQLLDLDGWEIDDLHEALRIIDNEIVMRCNEQLEGLDDD